MTTDYSTRSVSTGMAHAAAGLRRLSVSHVWMSGCHRRDHTVQEWLSLATRASVSHLMNSTNYTLTLYRSASPASLYYTLHSNNTCMHLSTMSGDNLQRIST